jgi:uncharacterized Zn finger protein
VDDWPRYVSAAERRLNAAQALAALRKRGAPLSPVALDGRTIARTFWGRAWCENLERYSDFANRLPRGRSYVRNGAVVDLQITPGTVAARVSGSDLYRVAVNVGAVPSSRWSSICHDCAGEIDSLVALLQGRLSERVMTRLCEDKTGLFPSPREIAFTCSCPDRASMCKHVAAVLYGIGSRLDREPDLLFVLRRVDQQDLVVRVGATLERGRKRPLAARVLETDLSEMFGIEISDVTSPAARPPRQPSRAKKPRSLGHGPRRDRRVRSKSQG